MWLRTQGPCQGAGLHLGLVAEELIPLKGSAGAYEHLELLWWGVELGRGEFYLFSPCK